MYGGGYMRKRIPSRVIKTISINNYSSYFNYLNINRPYNLLPKNNYDLGTVFYTIKMRTTNLLNNDYITENSFDYYA